MRKAEIKRKTKETDISLKLNIDGTGEYKIQTGVGFFDHMLSLFAKHGCFDIELNCTGDLHIDTHHTIEDTGIVLGKAFAQAMGDMKGIKRYSAKFIPMDEALVRVCADISGRPYLVYDMPLKIAENEIYLEFFRAFILNAGITLHISLLYGENDHHKLEASFKGAARALREALSKDGIILGIPSTKGVL